MKNLYQKVVKILTCLKKNIIALVFKWLNSLKKDFSFYNSHTELLAIWTILFMIIAGFFVLAIKSTILVMFLFFIFSVMVMFVGVFAAAYYLHAVKHHNKKRFLPKPHNLFNKSFKLRTLLRLIKIPHISIPGSLAKNLKLAP